MKRPSPTEHGMALIITLAFIVMIAIVIAGLATSMRTDRPAASLFSEREQAAQFAQTGVDNVIGILSKYSSLTSGTGTGNWITQPGQLVASSTGKNQLSIAVPLHSGSAVTAVSAPVFLPPNLNVPTFRDPNSLLISSGTTPLLMQVAWVYVRKSGALDVSTEPAISGTDPIVGRYAFWTDDESSKVNYNIAWGRTDANTNPPGSVTKIDLTAFPGVTGTIANGMRSAILGSTTLLSGSAQLMGSGSTQEYSFFNTPEDARRVETITPGAASALQDNKFELTHYNHDPNTTFFNEPRIVLTTRPDRAGWTRDTTGAYPNQWVGVNGKPWPDGRPYYLRILKNEGTVVQPDFVPPKGSPLDPGYSLNIDAQKINDTIVMLAYAQAPNPSYMQRNDWPMVSAPASIQDKYYSNYSAASGPNGISVRTSRLAQLALNIIDYVRAKESPQPLVAPIRGIFVSSATPPAILFKAGVDGSTDSYMGISRTPYVTEIGIWLGVATEDVPSWDPTYIADVAKGDVVYKLKVEVYLPENYGIQQLELNGMYGYFDLDKDKYSDRTGVTHTHSLVKFRPTEIQTSSGGTILKAGQYATITLAQKTTYSSGFSRPSTVALRFSLQNTSRENLDEIPVALNGTVSIPIDPTAVAENDITSIETDDPRVNKQPADWIKNGNGNTFGRVNNCYSGGRPTSHVTPTLPTGAPQFDTDADGSISTASFYMPPPAGSVFVRPDGSVDDNTRGMVLSAGELGYVHTGIEAATQVTNGAGGNTSVPPGTPWRTLRLQPSNAPDSVVPDWALMDLFTAPLVAPDQHNKYVYVPHDTTYGGRVNLNSKAEPFGLGRTLPLVAVLQGCTYNSGMPFAKLSSAEAQTIAENIYDRVLAQNGKQYGYSLAYDSPGEVAEIKGVADQGEKSEELVRQISNLITTRGNVFSVYSVGQTIKQTPDRRLIVTGEQRLHAMIERYLDPTANQVRFTPVYFRDLTP